MEKAIEKYALENAVKFKGKANPKALVGKIMGEFTEARENPKNTMEMINEIVSDVNKLSLDSQKEKLQELAPELLEKKEIKERDIFSSLKVTSKVNTCFPPGVEKYPHIGHAKALMVNYLLAQKYNGKFFIRYEDTNPKLVKKEFYAIMEENFKWLGVKWDKSFHASDYMDLYYELAEKMINKNKAYVCTCEDVQESRKLGIACTCRSHTKKVNIDLWKDMFNQNEGYAILRLKIDLKHKNSTMRDPTIFRIIDEKHARTGTKYKVWPNYDFQNSVMDSHTDVDIRLRSKEFELRSELQRWIQKELGIRETSTYEFARFNLTGVESSGRVIREKIEHGELLGWDDPSLTTLVALRRRGFQPKAIIDFLLSTGITKNEATLTWDDLIMHNKRLLDEEAERYFFVEDPVEIVVKDAPEQKIKLKKNPNNEKGFREFKVKDTFLISKLDYKNIKSKELIRLMDCLNFEKKGKEFVFNSLDYKGFKGKGKKIIHFLPNSDLIDVEILMPDKKVVNGKGSKYLKNLKVGNVIQFERFGFCRLDRILKTKLIFWFTH